MWSAAAIVAKFLVREIVFSFTAEHAVKFMKNRLKRKPTREEMSCSYEHLQMDDEEGDEE